MKNLSLIIPAKNESDSLPKVLDELKNFKLNIIVILEKSDLATIESIKNFNCSLVYQSSKGYGNALIEGINNVKTDYLCIFNADGSFDPKYLNEMLKKCEDGLDFVFASRYLPSGGTDDDTIITSFGNYIFSLLGRVFFSLKLSDILFTYLLGKTNSFKKLELESKDFGLCVEMPIKAKKFQMKYVDIPSYERKRIAGVKKVNELVDGFKILICMIKLFFKK
tara:strand:- start:78 stop:743 length:666 start_codon:yes stop_codon:yes gene_type:complete